MPPGTRPSQEGQQDVPRRPTSHTFEQVNWSNVEEETRIGVLQEMVAILLNRLDDIEAAGGQREAALDVPPETVIKDGLLELQRRYGRLSKVPGSELLRLHEAVAFLATPPVEKRDEP